MARTRTFHHGNLRQALLEAALDLLDAEGTAGVTIRAAAAKAGVSHAAPANHFKDRKALLTAVAKTQFELISERINSGLASRTKDRARIFRHDSKLCFCASEPVRLVVAQRPR